MDIQKNSGVNFGATRVLTVSKGQAITDVFRLDRNNINDRSFVKRCLGTMATRPDSAKPSMKSFLQSFLESYIPYNKGDYYIGIKNDETITGGVKAHHKDDRPDYYVYTGFGFNNDYSKLSKDCLIYSLLSETQSHHPNSDIVDGMMSNSVLGAYHNEMLLPRTGIGDITKQIEAKYPGYKFDTSNEDVNLESLMGINNLDDKILI